MSNSFLENLEKTKSVGSTNSFNFSKNLSEYRKTSHNKFNNTLSNITKGSFSISAHTFRPTPRRSASYVPRKNKRKKSPISFRISPNKQHSRSKSYSTRSTSVPRKRRSSYSNIAMSKINLDVLPKNISDVNFTVGLNKVSLGNYCITSLKGYGKRNSVKGLFLQKNHLVSFKYLEQQDNLEELDLSDNCLSSFYSFPKLPKLRVINLKKNPISNHTHYRLMLLICNENLSIINGLRVDGKERKFAKMYKRHYPLAAKCITAGWLLDLNVREEWEFNNVFEQYQRIDCDDRKMIRRSQLFSSLFKRLKRRNPKVIEEEKKKVKNEKNVKVQNVTLTSLEMKRLQSKNKILTSQLSVAKQKTIDTEKKLKNSYLPFKVIDFFSKIEINNTFKLFLSFGTQKGNIEKKNFFDVNIHIERDHITLLLNNKNVDMKEKIISKIKFEEVIKLMCLKESMGVYRIKVLCADDSSINLVCSSNDDSVLLVRILRYKNLKWRRDMENKQTGSQKNRVEKNIETQMIEVLSTIGCVKDPESVEKESLDSIEKELAVMIKNQNEIRDRIAELKSAYVRKKQLVFKNEELQTRKKVDEKKRKIMELEELKNNLLQEIEKDEKKIEEETREIELMSTNVEGIVGKKQFDEIVSKENSKILIGETVKEKVDVAVEKMETLAKKESGKPDSGKKKELDEETKRKRSERTKRFLSQWDIPKKKPVHETTEKIHGTKKLVKPTKNDNTEEEEGEFESVSIYRQRSDSDTRREFVELDNHSAFHEDDINEDFDTKKPIKGEGSQSASINKRVEELLQLNEVEETKEDLSDIMDSFDFEDQELKDLLKKVENKNVSLNLSTEVDSIDNEKVDSKVVKITDDEKVESKVVRITDDVPEQKKVEIDDERIDSTPHPKKQSPDGGFFLLDSMFSISSDKESPAKENPLGNERVEKKTPIAIVKKKTEMKLNQTIVRYDEFKEVSKNDDNNVCLEYQVESDVLGVQMWKISDDLENFEKNLIEAINNQRLEISSNKKRKRKKKKNVVNK